MRNPIDRLTVGLPKGLRVTIDWLVTILGAILIVLAIKQWVINPYRIPSSSMEPTLHCALPGVGCLAQGRAPRRLRPRSRLPLLLRPLVAEARRHRRLQHPAAGRAAVRPGGVFVKRLIGLPGDTWAEKNGYVYINGKKLDEPYVKPRRPRHSDATRRRRSRRATTS